MDKSTNQFPELNSRKIDMESPNISVPPILLVPVFDHLVDAFMIGILFVAMVAMGCLLETKQIKKQLMKPKGIAIAIFGQYGIMPLLSFVLVKIFNLKDIIAMVVLVCGFAPGGVLSNIFVVGLKGELTLSIVSTTVSTALGIAMMPLLLLIYGQGFSANLQSSIPYGNIMLTLFLTLIPVSLGMIFVHFKPAIAKKFADISLPLAVGLMLGITGLIMIQIGGSAMVLLSPALLIIGTVLPLLGFAAGYILSVIFKLSKKERRTVAVETGCQNVQLSATILKMEFPPNRIGTFYMFPMLYLVLQTFEAAIIILLYWSYRRYRNRKRGVYRPDGTRRTVNDSSDDCL